MTWLSQNLPTILICLGLAALVTLIVIGMIRDKKKGKSCCGGCVGCSMSGSCHQDQTK